MSSSARNVLAKSKNRPLRVSSSQGRARPKKVKAWAWMIRRELNGTGPWELCYWAEPSRRQLMARSKPSPEAVAVRVELIRPLPRKAQRRSTSAVRSGRGQNEARGARRKS